MRKFLATKSGVNYGLKTGGAAIGGSWELNLLIDGGLAIFDGTGNLIDGLAPVITTPDFYIATGRANAAENTEKSPMLFREGFSYSKLVYTAPVAKVMYLGWDTVHAAYDLAVPASPVVGTIARVRIVDLDKEAWDPTREKVIEYVVKSGDTQALVVTGLVAALNAHADKYWTATDNTVGADIGITLTGTTLGKNFTAYAEGIISGATIVEYKMVNRVYSAADVTAVAAAKGNGTYAQIKAWSDDFSTNDGNHNLRWFSEYFWSVSSNLSSSGTYTIYILTSTNPSDGRVLINEKNPPVTVILAIPSGEVGATAAITVMDNFLAAV